MKTVLSLILFISSLTVQGQSKWTVLDSYNLKTLNKKRSLSQVLGKENAVFIFYSPDCPLSQKYTLALQQIFEKYHADIDFVGIFPGQGYTNNEYKNFKKKYPIPYELIRDEQLKLTRFFGATTTPEVFLVSESGKVLYHGAIDNGIIKLGSSRKAITKHYLTDAINQTLKNKPVNITFSNPVGCFIEK